MAIPLGVTEFNNFVGGRTTNDNLTGSDPSYSLISKNVIHLGDGNVRKMPGYTLVNTLAGKVKKIYDFQRDSDGAQFIFVQHDGTIGWIKADGTGAETVLVTGQDTDRTFDFVKNYFNAYGSNGLFAYKFADNAGTLTKYQHGISAPASAPTEALVAGSLNMTYGRQAVYCYVSKIVDSTGVTRTHIGPPSPISAHTGPFTAKAITWGSILASTDPQVTHIWVFTTADTPLDSTAAYYFNAEITNGTTSYGDSLADASLDNTRLAPFDNNPAPAADILVEFQNRLVALNGDTCQVSGYDEVDLGIPQEAWPAQLFFKVPGGKEKFSGAAVIDEGQTLLLGTRDYWFAVQGFNEETFVKRDRVASPGPAGKKAIAVTPAGVVWLGPDKKLWLWSSGMEEPLEISRAIQRRLTGTINMDVLSMEDLSDQQLANAEVRYFSFGRHRLIAVLASTTTHSGDGAFDWMQVWEVDINDASTPFRAGSIKSVMESDLLPNDLLACAGLVEVNATKYLFFGDFSTGAVYRWPDGFQHNGKAVKPVLGTAWTPLGAPDVTQRMFWADIYTDRQMVFDKEENQSGDGGSAFQVAAVVSDGANMQAVPVGLPMGSLPSMYATDPTVARCNMNQKGTSIGKLSRYVIIFPDDADDATLQKIAIAAKPLSKVNP